MGAYDFQRYVTLRFGHLCSQWFTVCGFSMHRGHVGLSSGSSSGMCPDRRRARRAAHARLEVIRLLVGGSVLTDQMRAFVVANQMACDWLLLVVVRLRPCCLILLPLGAWVLFNQMHYGWKRLLSRVPLCILKCTLLLSTFNRSHDLVPRS